MIRTRITELFGIEHPIFQGGMRSMACAELVAAVVNAGCMGFVSAHTHPKADDLRREILRTRALTSREFGVNLTVLPMLKDRDYDGYVQVILESGIKFVETAGSNPAKYIDIFKKAGIKVLHKCPSSIRFAVKAQELGADAVSLHGFECGGHPGEDDIPGMVLLPAAAEKVRIPMLSSGGVANGRGLAAALALGADGVVMGTRFMLTRESPLHPSVKQRMIDATIKDTVMVGRSVHDSSRVLRNALVEQVLGMEQHDGVTYPDLFPLIGAERWIEAYRRGDPEDGAFPAGMVVGLIDDLPSCAEMVERLVREAAAIMSSRLPGMLV